MRWSVPTALAVVREILRADLPADERRWLILDADFVLGLDLDRQETRETIPDAIRDLLDERAAARRARDFATSDRLRDELAERGYRVMDGPESQTVERR